MIDVAKKAAIDAGKKVFELQSKDISVRKKEKKGDFATKADDASEKIILEAIRDNFPEHNILSEESGKENKGSEYTWVIDPLDGTIPFKAGLQTYGISIGLLKGYKPYLGVINLPCFDTLCWAVKGNGSYINGKEISVSDTKDLKEAVVGFDLAHMGDRKEELKDIVEQFADEVRYPPTLGCTVAGMVFVANGVYDAYIHSAYPWDFAAGTLIVEEAGGRVTDYKGEGIDWTKDWIDCFASNRTLHKKFLELLE